MTEEMFTKQGILKILAIIAIDHLPDEYSPEVLEIWLQEAIETLKHISSSED